MKKMQKILSAILPLVILVTVLPPISVTAWEPIGEITTELISDISEIYYPSSPFDILPAEEPDIPENNPEYNLTQDLPSSYDLREEMEIPPIRNQNPYGSCWAHACIAAIEVSLIKQGLATADIDLSELNLVENTYSRVHDKFGLLGEDELQPIGKTALYRAGNSDMVSNELARWSGVCDEKAMTYSTDAEYEDNDGYYSDDYYYALNEVQPVKSVSITTKNRNLFKQNIMKYGICVAYFYSDPSYRNNSTGAIYSNVHTGNVNHSVAIIGWDDNYAVSNFNSKARPKKPGAWLVRNSWGTSGGKGGYYWLSYEDTSFYGTATFFYRLFIGYL